MQMSLFLFRISILFLRKGMNFFEPSRNEKKKKKTISISKHINGKKRNTQHPPPPPKKKNVITYGSKNFTTSDPRLVKFLSVPSLLASAPSSLLQNQRRGEKGQRAFFFIIIISLFIFPNWQRKCLFVGAAQSSVKVKCARRLSSTTATVHMLSFTVTLFKQEQQQQA